MAFLNNPHAPLAPGLAGVVTWLVGLEPVFATALTIMSIAWYVWQFYDKWKEKYGKRS